MKTDIHPDYRPVVFLDTSSGEKFLTRSTVQTDETTEWEDGHTYPLAKIEISSASHPFFTGQMTIVDTAGRVERFERRYGKRRRAGSPEAKAEAEAEAKAKAEAEAKKEAEAKAEKAKADAKSKADAKAEKAEADAKSKAEAEASSEASEPETDSNAEAADAEATSEES